MALPRSLFMLAAVPCLLAAAGEPGSICPVVPDAEALVGRNDVVCLSPITHGGDAMPIGNGDLGAMFWTPAQSDCLLLQINKVDVWRANRTSYTSWGVNGLPGCARLAIHTEPGYLEGIRRFEQRLDLYRARITMAAAYARGAVEVEAFVAAGANVLVLDYADSRPGVRRVGVELCQWRSDPKLKVTARGDVMLVDQVFEAKGLYTRYVLAAAVEGARAKAVQPEPRSAMLEVTGSSDLRFTVLLSAAVSQDPKEDVQAKALAGLTAARRAGRKRLQKEHERWWARRWGRSFVYLTSDDGAADYLENIWTLHFYQLASSSRGAYPPKFNGSIWLTEGDRRGWGGQYWVWNTVCSYYPIFTANHIDLGDPFYRMYWAMLPLCRRAARQRWGVGGAHYPEVCPHDGPIELTDQQAAEVRAFMRGKATTVSPATARAVFGDGTLTNVARSCRYTYPSHILSSGTEIAQFFWWRYQYTRDKDWLRTRAYPLMKDVARFYLDYFTRGPDGRYHIYPTNVHEKYWGVEDGIMDLAAVRFLLPALVEASEALAVDADMRTRWREFLSHLAPYPTSEMERARQLEPDLAPGVFAPGLMKDVSGRRNAETTTLTPVFAFGDIGLKDRGTERFTRAVRTLRRHHAYRRMFADGFIGWSRLPVMVARLGLADEAARAVLSHTARNQPYANGLGTYAGRRVHCYPEGTAIVTTALNEMLLQSHDGTIRVCPAWPRRWGAVYRLRAAGGFLVTAACRNGQVAFVHVRSTCGGPCRLENPWPTRPTISDASGVKVAPVKTVRQRPGLPTVLAWDTTPGQTVLVRVPGAAHERTTPRLLRPTRNHVPKTLAVGYDSGTVRTVRIGLPEISARPFTYGRNAYTRLPVGPVPFDSHRDYIRHFYPGRHEENVSQTDRYGGTLRLVNHDGKTPHTHLTFSEFPTIAYGPNCDLGDVVVEMDVAYEDRTGGRPGQRFWVFARQREIDYGSNVWKGRQRLGRWQRGEAIEGRVQVSSGKAYLRLHKAGASRHTPVKPGHFYRLRLTCRNRTGTLARIADVVFELIDPKQPDKPLAKVTRSVNLCALSLPNAGEVGIKVYQRCRKPTESARKAIYVDNFVVRRIGRATTGPK